MMKKLSHNEVCERSSECSKLVLEPYFILSDRKKVENGVVVSFSEFVPVDLKKLNSELQVTDFSVSNLVDAGVDMSSVVPMSRSRFVLIDSLS